ncbi:MAG: succinyldiaminopimelate transaminase [Gammaproteobacteria bacterium]|nr:succinyldiaminopimelate transaminase [Gammaproteobacteria bacterium]
MNPHLDALQAYPFERLAALTSGIETMAPTRNVPLEIGEPKHAPPDFVVEALRDARVLGSGLAAYPPTRGGESLRAAVSEWLARRYGARVDAERQILPVNGTREALFSFGQAILSGSGSARVLLPNPFYQIYEGAAVLRGATPWYIPCAPDGTPDFDCIDDSVWRTAELVYICSPGNPTGAVIPEDELRRLIERSDRFDFVIASDECYSEIYRDESVPPVGLLQAAAAMGNTGFRRCVAFNSLSKRSNLPGLRSGFAVGDADIIERFYLYRTYHGCAMPAHVQAASALAWGDEAHVRANRARYREKFEVTHPILCEAMDVEMPEASFYLWPRTPLDDETFARKLYETENITVMPGSYLGRWHQGVNAGAHRIRIALVSDLGTCADAVRRIRNFALALH